MFEHQLKENFTEKDLMFIGQIAHDIESCLTEKFKHLKDSQEIGLATYAFAMLGLDHCQFNLGIEVTSKLLKEYQDELEAHFKDQKVKGTSYKSYA